MKYKHLFGPVVSRRLGISLGVDVVPYKYCSLNCVYCEVSRTTHQTLKRKAFFAAEEITGELDAFLAGAPELDYITFSGAGEPTLNSSLGEIISYIKSRHPQYKLALITNGTLLADPGLRREILPCDLIIPSLDAVSESAFELINRPCDKLTARDLIEGLLALRAEYGGLIWLEIFIVPGINDTLEEIGMLKAAAEEIRPDKVQLNTLDRPAAEEWVQPAIYLTLDEIRTRLGEGNRIPIEIVARTNRETLVTVSEQKVLSELEALLREGEYSKQKLAKHLQIHVNEVSKLLQHLALADLIKASHKRKGIYYQWKK